MTKHPASTLTAILSSVMFLIEFADDALGFEPGLNPNDDWTHAYWLVAAAVFLGLLGGGLFPAASRRFRQNERAQQELPIPSLAP